MSGWPYLYSYHVLAWFNGEPSALSEDDVRRVLRRVPPMCLAPPVTEAAETPPRRER